MKSYLIIPKVSVLNANAHSSPFTVGFPAMTAWLGAMHALQRKLNVFSDSYRQIKFCSMAVSCHEFNMRYHKDEREYEYSIVGTRNPLKKNEEPPAFIEEPCCHLKTTLLIECKELPDDFSDEIPPIITDLLRGSMKIAGGDILDFEPPIFQSINDFDKDFRFILRKLMPGYVLIERRGLMTETMNEGKNGIDSLLDYLTIKHRIAETDEKNSENPNKPQTEKKVKWESKRKTKGWIVPIATGFHGVTPLGNAKNQRDPEIPHRFAESVITLGEFVMPHRIEKPSDMLWQYHVDTEKNLYLCQQINQP